MSLVDETANQEGGNTNGTSGAVNNSSGNSNGDDSAKNTAGGNNTPAGTSGNTDSTGTNADSAGDSGSPGTNESDRWYYDDTMPGVGNKPEWLLPKFKNAAEQAKSFAELEKKFGAFKGAPDEYSLDIADLPQGFKYEAEDPAIKDFLADAKKNNVSQEYVSNLLKTYAQMQLRNKPDPVQELAKLGVNAKHDIQILAQWGTNVLTPDEFVQFKNMMTTAESVRLLEKLRGLATGADTAPGNPNTPQESEGEVLRMIHDPRYDSDENYRNMVREKLKQFGS